MHISYTRPGYADSISCKSPRQLMMDNEQDEKSTNHRKDFSASNRDKMLSNPEQHHRTRCASSQLKSTDDMINATNPLSEIPRAHHSRKLKKIRLDSQKVRKEACNATAPRVIPCFCGLAASRTELNWSKNAACVRSELDKWSTRRRLNHCEVTSDETSNNLTARTLPSPALLNKARGTTTQHRLKRTQSIRAARNRYPGQADVLIGEPGGENIARAINKLIAPLECNWNRKQPALDLVDHMNEVPSGVKYSSCRPNRITIIANDLKAYNKPTNRFENSNGLLLILAACLYKIIMMQHATICGAMLLTSQKTLPKTMVHLVQPKSSSNAMIHDQHNNSAKNLLHMTPTLLPQLMMQQQLLNHNNINMDSKANFNHNDEARHSESQNSPDEARAAHWSLPNRPSLFSIIRFPNEECFDSSNQSGTCYTAFECKLLGGQPSSPCAAGFGSCCIVSRSCHVSTREKVVYFKNPSYPSADTEERFCDLTVEVSDPNVCQLRLDFLDFQLDPPTQGACRDDYMEISASGIPPLAIPRLCGLNRNQHLYISVPQDYNQADRSASMVFYTDPVGDHRWQVKITQIDCNLYKPIDWRRGYAKLVSSPLWNAHPNAPGGGASKLPLASQLAGNTKYSTTFASGFQAMSQTASALAYELLKPQYTPRAPMGCLQYFTSTSGLIESFNFGQYLNNLDYSICIQRQPETCRVFFSSSDFDWSINGVGVSASTSGVGDQDCSRDYLMIPGGSRTGDGITYDRYCGGRLHYYRGQTLSSPVLIKTSGPIVLRFHSDAHYEGLNNGGFRLQYDQSAQDCIFHTQEEAGSLASQQLIAATLSDSRPFGAGGSTGFNMAVESVPVHYSNQLSSSNGANLVQQQQQLGESPVASLPAPLASSASGSLANRRQDNYMDLEPSEHDTRFDQSYNRAYDDAPPEPPSSLWNLGTEAARWLGASASEELNKTRRAALTLASNLGRAFQLDIPSPGEIGQEQRHAGRPGETLPRSRRRWRNLKITH